jgi:hypothetical protein
MSTTYQIVRFYRDDAQEREVIATGLTLEEAQAHCHHPETSSATCTSAEGLARTAAKGEWFDGYADGTLVYVPGRHTEEASA